MGHYRTRNCQIEGDNISDKVVSYLRTVVPVLWGSVVSFILQFVGSDLNEPISNALNSEPVGIAVTAIVIGVWYWLWRRVEPHIPDWLTRIVLGSAKAPTYE